MTAMAVERVKDATVHQVYVMRVYYLETTQMWLDSPGRPCTGAVFLDPEQAHQYATGRNLADLVSARAMLEQWGYGKLDFPASFDYFYVRTRSATASELAVLYWEGA